MLTPRKTALLRLFYGFFALCFLWLTLRITVNGGWYYYDYTETGLLAGTALALGVFALVWQVIKKHEAALARHSRPITAAFLLAMGMLQMVLGLRLRYQPVFDIDAVFGGAAQWAQTGTFSSYYDYYYTFFNNFGGMRFLYWIFRLAGALGIRDLYLAATAANCLLSLATMFATGQAAKKLLGVRGQMMAYTLFALSPPFYFIAPAFYTDALSMPFHILTYWLWLVAKERPRRRDRLGLYVLMGIFTAIGAQIKATVLIIFIAIALDGILKRQWKRTAAMALIAAAILSLGQAGLERDMYRHLDRETSEQRRTPLLHWVMMGLSGNGMYDPEDYAFTQSFTDRDEQHAALKAEIARRIREMGLAGLARHLSLKGNILFGDGTYGLSDCLGGEPLTETKLREWVLPGGNHNRTYKHLCTGVLLALYILMTAASLRDALFPQSTSFQVLIPRLAVFGLMLFLLGWEARWRYFSNFIPLIFLSALPGLDVLRRKRR